MQEWAETNLGSVSADSYNRFNAIAREPNTLDDVSQLRASLLDFIADFANWDNSTAPEYLATSRALTQSAHEALGGAPNTRPLLVDTFAGGGSIPFEALRVGADAFASDLNPIPVLLNKIVLEYIPEYGQRLADEVRKWGAWVRREAERELATFYPSDPDGAMPIAYLWARTVRCEGPSCGVEVPLIRSLWLAKTANRSVALQLVPNPASKSVDARIITRHRDGWRDQDDATRTVLSPKFEGTVKRGSATCPSCGYTTPVSRVREQLKAKHGGTRDARLLAVVTNTRTDGRRYRLPSDRDLSAVNAASDALVSKIRDERRPFSFVPNESTEEYHSFVNRGPIYGMLRWADYFTLRQGLTLATLTTLVRDLPSTTISESDSRFSEAVKTVLGLGVSRLADICNAFCMWETSKTQVRHLFTKQAIPMMWDFAETCVFSGAAGDFATTMGTMVKFLEAQVGFAARGHSIQASATAHPLPTDAANAFVTDPPYYYSVQYSDLSDFFYVWLKRTLSEVHPHLFVGDSTPKHEEIIVQSPGHQFAPSGKNNAFYEAGMRGALAEGRRITAADGLGVIVFAHTSTSGWETLLQAMIDAGWIVTASWPIDTELANRLISVGRSVLASSVHLVCRPREDVGGSLRDLDIGDWREVLAELPRRIHEWMPRLADEGVVGADAIFACLGPALEVFSRYSRVEKASGEAVSLRDYLEHVWAVVAREALSMVLDSADTSGLEPDGRLTAIWLWTLTANGSNAEDSREMEDEADDEDAADVGSASKLASSGFVLDFDTARKIAMGLGATLDELPHMVEVKRDKARLLPVIERADHLFGKGSASGPAPKRPRKKQLGLFAALDDLATDEKWEHLGAPEAGKTTLDRIHQAMLLFGAGRGETLKRFVIEGGVGNQPQFWKLAQSLSALYPGGTDEKRWIDGVLARKKSFGFA